MRTCKELTSDAEIETFIQENSLAFLFISQPNCSVCHGLKPQVQELMEKFPNIQLAEINTMTVPTVAGRFSIFTVPVLLLFVYGKEYIREARIVHMDLLEEKLTKIYENIDEI